MALEALDKIVDQLKTERTTAKVKFTKQANILSKGADSMIKAELKEEFRRFSDARRVLEGDYRTGLLAEMEENAEDGVEVELDKQQTADLEKRIKDCEMRVVEVGRIVQTNLWTGYGQDEMSTAVQGAERAHSHAERIHVESVDYEGFDTQPEAEKDDLEGRVKRLKIGKNCLEVRKV
ncbi:hypothetical protein NHX12_028694 [Muraenolepis orangiensis]|uniref:Uncharacterized protein n=1 Tax=Muraenolepis orangiensis TaxID=630683 RepID=A0A9Q0ECM1_9TELE|nr:hypothetical protein NHX12_028694 [Muraenolepis orangiensis]